jgi:hypothetical protein
MGKFDDSIAWCKERRDTALAEFRDMESGHYKYSLNDVDITAELMARARTDVERFNILIHAYESQDAKGA